MTVLQKHFQSDFVDKEVPSLYQNSFISLSRSFEEVVDQYANSIALKSPEENICYRDLNVKANQIAQLILRHSNGKHGNIVLLFEQGTDAIASIFGVLKGGCAFVPLDASTPIEMSKSICAKCSPLALLTNNENEQLAREVTESNIPVININVLPADLPEENPELNVDADSIGSIFFTSGSTGNPKGVCQSQRNLYHFVKVYCEQLSVSANDSVSMFYSLGFAASNMDVLGALLHGAKLCTYDIRKRGTAGLADWLDKSDITILHTVPSVFRILMRSLESGRKLLTVNSIDLGGETVFSSDIRLFREHFRDDCFLINHLAATEASVIAQYRIAPEDNYQETSVPVGYAAKEVLIEVLGPDGKETAIGEPGEIVIHSPYVSPGYWNLDELNRKVFEESEKVVGWRAYRSGDLGYFCEDRKLYFLGRSDFRVKIRGHLVDTNEIEEAIHKCAKVQDVAVVARSLQDDSTTQLVAYVVPDDGALVNLTDLRKSLATYLQNYKIPSDFVLLKTMPKNSSGKIDRNELAKLNLKEKRSREINGAFQNDVERRIAGFFNRLLETEYVGRNSDFFLLGGNSLQAMELHLYAEKEFGIQMPVHILFEDPTVAGISACVEKHMGRAGAIAEKRAAIVPLRKTGTNPILFLVHGTNGQAFASPYFLEILGESQPLYAFQASGLTEAWHRSPSIEEMASQYIDAIKVVQPSGPYLIGAICLGSIIAIEMANQLRARGDHTGPLLLIDPPLKLIDPPLKHRKSYLGFTRLRHYVDHFIHRRSVKGKWLERFKKRAEQGRILLDVADKNAVRVATKSVMSLSLASKTYRLQPYAGPLLLLLSSERFKLARQRRSQYLLGDLKIFEVGDKHKDIHTVGNERFKLHLRTCLKLAIEQTRSL